MFTLDATKTALVVIDLQEGILPFAGGPHTADDVVSRAARLAEKCRASGSPVVMVRVGWSADFAEALKQPVDAQAPAQALPDNWWTYPVSLGKRDSDIEVTKRQWGAFYGTDLELQLRRRGIDTIILCGIALCTGRLSRITRLTDRSCRPRLSAFSASPLAKNSGCLTSTP